MNILDMACYITVGQAAEDPEKLADLERAFNQSFKDLADGFFSNSAKNIGAAFSFAAENPLCIALVSCLLVVAAFHLIPSILRIFGGRG